MYVCVPSYTPVWSTLCVPAGEKWCLSAEDVECVAVGAGLLGCGGGGDPNVGRLVALRQLAQGRTITVINPLRYTVHTPSQLETHILRIMYAVCCMVAHIRAVVYSTCRTVSIGHGCVS